MCWVLFPQMDFTQGTLQGNHLEQLFSVHGPTQVPDTSRGHISHEAKYIDFVPLPQLKSGLIFLHDPVKMGKVMLPSHEHHILSCYQPSWALIASCDPAFMFSCQSSWPLASHSSFAASVSGRSTGCSARIREAVFFS